MTQQNPITDEQLNEIAARAAGLYEYATGLDTAWQDEADQLAGTDVPALLAAVRRLRDALTAIRHLHKDSPMGPCPVCIDADALAAGGDGLVPYPCPTGRLAGAQDCDPPHVRAAVETGTGPCGHDDYHDPHEWADRPGVWCPGISYADDEPAPAVAAVSSAAENGDQT